MSVIGSRNFQFGFLVVAAVSMLPTVGQAYTPEQEQACTPDAFRLCSSDIPDIERVTACMVRNRSQLSPGCRAYFRPDPEPSQASAAGKPINIRPATTR